MIFKPKKKPNSNLLLRFSNYIEPAWLPSQHLDLGLGVVTACTCF